jgi:CRISPR-associated endoribonuclease Cas6
VPSKLRFHLTGEPPAHPFQHASGLRALLLDWLGRTAPERAADLHQANQPKPYTISPLWPEENDTAHLWFDVSLLDDRLAPLLSVAAGEEQEVRLGPQHFTLASLPERREAIAWEELVPEVVCQRPRLLVRLLTPTAHHAAGPHRKVVVSPSPETYFKGWLGRWNLCATRWGCAPFVIDESVLEAVESHVAIAALSGRSEVVRALDPRRHFTGFVGEVTFEVLKPHTLSHGLRASLEALGRFANYAGTGIETMRGMGQTQVRILGKPPRPR